MLLQIERIRRQLGFVALCVILLSWGLGGYHVSDVSQRMNRESERQIRQSMLAFQTTVQLSLAVADQTLLRLQDIAQSESLATAALEASYISRPSGSSPINRAAIIGTDGKMRANFLNGKPAPLLDVHERDYFATFASTPTDRIFANEPVRGKASGQWIQLFSRPIIRHGKFDGVVFVGFESSALAVLFAEGQRQDMLISLLSPNGHIMARSANSAEQLGKAVAIENLPQPGRTVLYKSPLDQEERLSATTRIPDWNLLIYVGIEKKTLDRELRRQAIMAFAPATLLTLLLLVALYLIRRTLAGHEQLMAERAADAQETQSILDNMSDGVLVTNAQGTVLTANIAASRQIQSSAPLVGLDIATLLWPTNASTTQASPCDELRLHRHWSGHMSYRHRAGRDQCARVSAAVTNAGSDSERFIFVTHDLSQQEQQEHAHWRNTHFDTESGLPNRQHFDEVLAERITGKQPLSLLRVGLANTPPADQPAPMHRIAHCLPPLPPGDGLYRWKGDSFAVLFSGTHTVAELSDLARRILHAVGGTPDEAHCPWRLSIGIARIPVDADDADNLITAADFALFTAKSEGENHFVIFGHNESPAIH